MAIVNKGMVSIKSIHNRYLQSHSDDGETHASNDERNTEETWFLFQIGEDVEQTFALMNWSNGCWLARNYGCVYAVNPVLAMGNGTFTMIRGGEYKVPNAVAFRSQVEGHLLRANAPNDNYKPCGGEVYCAVGGECPEGDANWSGWWVMEPCGAPTEGKDLWNTIGRAIQALGQSVANEITPANVTAIIKTLA